MALYESTGIRERGLLLVCGHRGGECHPTPVGLSYMAPTTDWGWRSSTSSARLVASYSASPTALANGDKTTDRRGGRLHISSAMVLAGGYVPAMRTVCYKDIYSFLSA